MKSIYQTQLDSLGEQGLRVGDTVLVEMHFHRGENTKFVARIEIAVENPEQYKIGRSCHFSDEPIKLRVLENCTKDWQQKGHLTPIHNVVSMKKLTNTY